VVAGFAFPFVYLANAILNNAPSAILASALSAAVFAYLSMRSQRATSRLSKTFETINEDLWDEDVLKARQIYALIKKEIRAKKISIATYCYVGDSVESPGQGVSPPDNAALTPEAKTLRDERLKQEIALTTILNDFENLALGVRHNILDEDYLYRWMRGSLLIDWDELSPLVTAYRHLRGRPVEIYVEFEGLAAAWGKNRSYRTGRKLKKSLRLISVH
jgi:hypothetical protein